MSSELFSPNPKLFFFPIPTPLFFIIFSHHHSLCFVTHSFASCFFRCSFVPPEGPDKDGIFSKKWDMVRRRYFGWRKKTRTMCAVSRHFRAGGQQALRNVLHAAHAVAQFPATLHPRHFWHGSFYPYDKIMIIILIILIMIILHVALIIIMLAALIISFEFQILTFNPHIHLIDFSQIFSPFTRKRCPVSDHT